MIYKTQNLIICLLLLQIVAFGSTLSQYRQKIKDVTESVGYLNYPEEYLSDAENIAQQREILKEIRTKLPPIEKIELKDTNFEVNHDWLYEKLKQFENEPYRSIKRTPIIEETLERLSALESKVEELERQELSKRTKDEDKQKLDEILRRAEYQKPAEKEETWFQRKWREFLEWLQSFDSGGKKEEQTLEGSPAMASALLYIVLAIAVAFIGFLIYYFAPSLLKQIRNREKKDKNSRVILGETLSAEDSSNSIFAEAEDLARTGNLRGAIRKGYIALLCELSDKKLLV
ncbi:MAG: hypothetical protein HC846_00540 [Blastocatellia bacterium]|nr:hypothetical protein [Blastocatellia bacterium]